MTFYGDIFKMNDLSILFEETKLDKTTNLLIEIQLTNDRSKEEVINYLNPINCFSLINICKIFHSFNHADYKNNNEKSYIYIYFIMQ